MRKEGVYVHLIGGIGNQLFQYALGRKIALLQKCPLLLDTSWYRSDRARQSQRKFLLDELSIRAEFCTPEEVYELFFSRRWKSKIRRSLDRNILPIHRRRIIVEKAGHILQRGSTFDGRILKIKQTAYLSGYWASYRYFQDIEEILTDELGFKIPIDSHNSNLISEMQSQNSVSVHVRRGDFLKHDEFGTCSPGFYESACLKVLDTIEQPIFYVFSDNIPWARANLTLGINTRFIDINRGRSPTWDLRLMSACKHHVNSNSTFSWWAAWLGRHESQLVIVPNEWFIGLNRCIEDIYPENWLTLPSK